MANRNFKYSPGLPGYGTQGIDGSSGLQGLGMYFSEFDGVTDSITIKSKIIANKILFSIDEVISGYPIRLYQTGDIFIDVNGVVWKIDLSEINRYKSTNASLIGDDFFTYLKTVAAIGHDRYFPADKNLTDIFFSTSTAIDYTVSPSSIYVSNPDQFAQWKYVDVQSVGGSEIYYPFEVYSIGGANADSIALTREASANVWHLGNLDDAESQREVSMKLDFKNVETNGVLQVDGSIISYGNFNFLEIRRKSGGGGHFFKIKIKNDSMTGAANIILESQDGKDNSNSPFSGGANGGDTYIRSGYGGNGVNGGAGGSAYNGGLIELIAKDGGFTPYAVSSVGVAGDGGIIHLYAGHGGDTSSGTIADAGLGGNINIIAGKAGKYQAGGGQEDVPSRNGYIQMRTGIEGFETTNQADINIEAGQTGPDLLRGDIINKSENFKATAINKIGLFSILDMKPDDVSFHSDGGINLKALSEIRLEAEDVSISTSNNIAFSGNIISVKPANSPKTELRRHYWADIEASSVIITTSYQAILSIDTEDTTSKNLILKFSGATKRLSSAGNMNFKFERSNDNSSWTTILVIIRNQFQDNSGRDEGFVVSTKVSTPWRYFRISCSSDTTNTELSVNSLFEAQMNE